MQQPQRRGKHRQLRAAAALQLQQQQQSKGGCRQSLQKQPRCQSLTGWRV